MPRPMPQRTVALLIAKGAGEQAGCSDGVRDDAKYVRALFSNNTKANREALVQYVAYGLRPEHRKNMP